MRPRTTLKTFRALSFDAGQVTDGTVPAIPDSQPRLTPESVRGFTAQHDGSAAGNSPRDERPAPTRHCVGRDGAAPQRIKLGRWLVMTTASPCPGSE